MPTATRDRSCAAQLRSSDTSDVLRCVTLAELALSGKAEGLPGGGYSAAANFAGGCIDHEVGVPVIGQKDKLVRTHVISVTKGV